MTYEDMILTFKEYCELNSDFEVILDRFLNTYSKKEIIKILNTKILPYTNDYSLVKALNFLFGINIETENYHFNIGYHYYANIEENYKQNFIEVKSNYINTDLLIKDLFQLSNLLTLKGNNKQLVLLDLESDISSFPTILKRVNFNNNYLLDELNIKSFQIYGAERELEILNDFLNQFFNPVFEYNEKVIIAQQIRSGLYFFSKTALHKSIDFILAKDEKLNEMHGLKFIEDLLNINLFEIDLSTLTYIYNNLLTIDLNNPLYYYNLILSQLKSNELKVIKARSYNNMTLEQVGQIFGVSRERIRQIESRSVNKIRKNECSEKLAQALILNTGYSSFFTENDFKKYNISGSFFKMIFPELFKYSLKEKIYFYNQTTQEIFTSFFLSLPDLFEENEFKNIIEKKLGNILSNLEIEVIKNELKQFFYQYGKYLSKNKLNHSTVVVFLMQKYFPNGINVYDENSLKILKKYAETDFNYQLSNTLRALKAIIENNCIRSGKGERIYIEKTITLSDELLHRIKTFLVNYNSSAVPISIIYDSFKKEFNEIGIFNKYYLQGILKNTNNHELIVTRDYILESKEASIYEEICMYISNSDYIVTTDELKEYFPGITTGIIQSAIAKTDILNMNGYYVDIKALKISLYEKNLLYASIVEFINDNKQHHMRFVLKAIKGKMNGLFNRIGLNHYLQLYSLVEKLFSDKFNFLRPYISMQNTKIVSGEELLLQKILDKGEVNIEELKILNKKTGRSSAEYLDFIEKNIDKIVFKNKNTVINSSILKIVDFNYHNFDFILEKFLGNDEYKPLYLFTSYWALPKLKIDWNQWVLYSAILKYSIKYTATTTSRSLKNAIPVLTIKNKKLATDEIEDIKARELTDSDYTNLVDYFDEDY